MATSPLSNRRKPAAPLRWSKFSTRSGPRKDDEPLLGLQICPSRRRTPRSPKATRSSMDRRALLLSRLQLAFTVSFHILPEKDVRFIVIEQLCLIRPLSLTPAGRCYLGPVPRRAPAGSHTALRPAKFNPVLRHDPRRLGDRTQARYGLAAKSLIEDLIRSGQSIHPPQAGHRIKWSACPSADRPDACRDICRAGERDVSRNCSAHSSRGAVDRADAGRDPGRFHDQPGGDRAGY